MIPTEVAIIAGILADEYFEDIEKYYAVAWRIYEALQNDK